MDARDKNILARMGLEAMPDQEAAETLAQLHDVVTEAILFRVMPRLIAGEQEELSRLVESKADGDTIAAYLKERVPEIDAIVAEETELARRRLARILPELSPEEKKFGAESA